MAYGEDHIALAAEYALGTLDADERAQVEDLMSVDKDFAALVQAWEYRLGVLNQMVGSVEPSPKCGAGSRPRSAFPNRRRRCCFPRRRRRLSRTKRSRLPSIPIVRPSSVLPGGPGAGARVATFTSAIAAALVALIAVGAYQPDLLPDAIRPKPRTQVVEVKLPPTPAPPSAQYVAVLQKDAGSPAFILTVDAATKNFTIRKVGAQPEPGKSFELWLISDKLPRPRSLGVIGNGDFTARPVLSGFDTDLVNNATYAVTVEQAGGSPDGNPHSAPVFTGKLIETVPQSTAKDR